MDTNVINLILISISIIIIISSNCTRSSQSFHIKDRGDEDYRIHTSVLAAGIFLWPVVWDYAIGYDKLFKIKSLIFAFLWPCLLLLFQIYDSSHDYREDIDHVETQRTRFLKSLHSDSSTIISIAFAMGTIFLVMSRLGHDETLYLSSRIVITALVICIAFIVPTSNFLNNSQSYTIYVRNLQRVFVTFSIGLIMASLLMMFSTSHDLSILQMQKQKQTR